MPEGAPPKSHMFPPGGSKSPRAPPDTDPESGPERDPADQKSGAQLYVFHTFVSETTLPGGPPNRSLSGHSFLRASPQGIRRESENTCFRVPISVYKKNLPLGSLSDPIGAPTSKIYSRRGSEPSPVGTSFRNPFRRRWPGAHDDSSTFSTPRFHETVRKTVPGRLPPKTRPGLKIISFGIPKRCFARSAPRVGVRPSPGSLGAPAGLPKNHFCDRIR